ncbi:hypothetical protein ACJX0J_038542, partial [Zea mays]
LLSLLFVPYKLASMDGGISLVFGRHIGNIRGVMSEIHIFNRTLCPNISNKLDFLVEIAIIFYD